MERNGIRAEDKLLACHVGDQQSCDDLEGHLPHRAPVWRVTERPYGHGPDGKSPHLRNLTTSESKDFPHFPKQIPRQFRVRVSMLQSEVRKEGSEKGFRRIEHPSL